MDLAGASAIGAIDPAVESPQQPVSAKLLIALGESGEEDAAFVGAAIAIRVLQEQKIRSNGHEQPAVPREHAVWKCEPIREHHCGFIPPIAIAIFEHANL